MISPDPEIRELVLRLAREAKARGIDLKFSYREFEAWLARFPPIAEKHDLTLGTVLDIYRLIIENPEPDRYLIARTCDKYGIPMEDMYNLCRDLIGLVVKDIDRRRARGEP